LRASHAARECSLVTASGHAAGQSYKFALARGTRAHCACPAHRRRRVATAFHGIPRDNAVISRVGASPGLSLGDGRGVYCPTQLRCNKSDDDQSSKRSARAGGGLLFEVLACPSALCPACVCPCACSRLAKPGALFPSTVSSSTWTDTMRILRIYFVYIRILYIYLLPYPALKCCHQSGRTREQINLVPETPKPKP
jgi:hypothetical protein